MFWFCKKKPITLTFYTTDETVFNSAKPQRASRFVPSWVHALPTKLLREDGITPNSTVRNCPGLMDLYQSGFIVPLWSDVNIKMEDSGYQYQFADQRSTIETHSATQFSTSPFAETHINLKFINPWWIFSDSAVKLLYIAPTWNDMGSEDMLLVPGIMSPNKCLLPLNVNFLAKKKSSFYELEFGSPLVHIVPLSEKPIVLKHELVTQEEIKSLLARRPMFNMFSHRFRRAEKLCPHAK